MTSLPPRRRRRRWVLYGSLAVLALAATMVLLARRSNANGAEAISADQLEIRVGKVETADIQVTVSEVGTIEPVVKVDVKSTLSGKITELLVREGDRVTRGQVLARVEPDVNQAQTLSAVRSQLNLAEIQARDAEEELARNRRLHDEGYVSDRELKALQVRFDSSVEDLDAARTKYRIVEESGIPLDTEISTSQRVNIVAPMDGYVIRRDVEVGQTVSSGLSSFNEGTALYTVADLGAMLIKAAVNEVDIGRVRLDMPVTITVDAFPYRRFEGRVTHISPAARLQDKVKVFDVEVTQAAQVPEFRAGMTANVEIRGDRADKVLSLPVEGVFRRSDGEVAYVLKKTFDAPGAGERPPRKLESGKYDVSDSWKRFFVERPVKIGLAGLERAQVLDGLAAGDEVALEDPTRPRRIEEED
ncbi:MAG: efflux RND transporter periplasmic adaptor subunit [Acidobacteria bacterium]|nr:efflux RND transporter periplasmic adaptor subunit [Acidobacteriota bacterium]